MTESEPIMDSDEDSCTRWCSVALSSAVKVVVLDSRTRVVSIVGIWVTRELFQTTKNTF